MEEVAIPLTLSEYQQRAARTMVGRELSHANLAIAGLGLAGESGEVADLIKKMVGHGHPLDRDKLIEELGDVLWYCAMLATLLDVKLDAVAVRNIQKLLKRYPDGFDPKRSLSRVEAGAHQAYEGG